MLEENCWVVHLLLQLLNRNWKDGGPISVFWQGRKTACFLYPIWYFSPLVCWKKKENDFLRWSDTRSMNVIVRDAKMLHDPYCVCLLSDHRSGHQNPPSFWLRVLANRPININITINDKRRNLENADGNKDHRCRRFRSAATCRPCWFNRVRAGRTHVRIVHVLAKRIARWVSCQYYVRGKSWLFQLGQA